MGFPPASIVMITVERGVAARGDRRGCSGCDNKCKGQLHSSGGGGEGGGREEVFCIFTLATRGQT